MGPDRAGISFLEVCVTGTEIENVATLESSRGPETVSLESSEPGEGSQVGKRKELVEPGTGESLVYSGERTLQVTGLTNVGRGPAEGQLPGQIETRWWEPRSAPGHGQGAHVGQTCNDLLTGWAWRGKMPLTHLPTQPHSIHVLSSGDQRH